jgi:hypothetical protein
MELNQRRQAQFITDRLRAPKKEQTPADPMPKGCRTWANTQYLTLEKVSIICGDYMGKCELGESVCSASAQRRVPIPAMTPFDNE